MVVMTLIISQVAMLVALIQRLGECAENEEQEDGRAKSAETTGHWKSSHQHLPSTWCRVRPGCRAPGGRGKEWKEHSTDSPRKMHKKIPEQQKGLRWGRICKDTNRPSLTSPSEAGKLWSRKVD